MGGERASKTRQRERGEICWKCGRWLGRPTTTPKRGYCANGRACEHCDPRQFRIQCHVMRREFWSVTFLEADCCTSIGPWLLYDTLDEVERILRWGHSDDPEPFRRSIEQWGVGGTFLNLTRMQRSSLIARRLGWPWNGYELAAMKRSGKYPPERLTPAQEAAFLRNRKRP